jgi:hypothetical protein
MRQSEKDVYKSLHEKPYESIYLHVEATIDHPVEKVWPHALDIGSWMNAHRLETVAGEPGKVGHFQRVLPQGLGPEVPQPHYHLYGIAEIVPFKLIVLEVFPEKGGSYGKTRPKMCFDSINLTDLGGRTHVSYLLIEANLGKGDKDFYPRRKAEIEAVRGLIGKFFDNLRQRVAEEG